MQSSVFMRGSLTVQHRHAPKVGLAYKVRNLPNILRAWKVPLAKALNIPTYYGTLRAMVRHADGSVVDYGLISARVVTTAFVNFVVDQLQTETSVFGDFKYHDSGTGTTAENVTDTGMETQCTEQEDELRAVGSQEEGASANIYKSIGTITYDGAAAITEHGLFNATRVGGGTLMDRSKFDAINVVATDTIAFTYQLTCTAGS